MGDGQWSLFFSLQSSRLMLVFPGDVAFIKGGTFHRVFTLQTKVRPAPSPSHRRTASCPHPEQVVAYDNYIDALTFETGLESIKRDLQQNDLSREKVCKLPVQLLYGLIHEADKQMSDDSALRVMLSSCLDNRMTHEFASNYLHNLVLGTREGDQRATQLDLFARAAKELQCGRPHPRINLLQLCKEVLALYDYDEAQASSNKSRKRKAPAGA